MLWCAFVALALLSLSPAARAQERAQDPVSVGVQLAGDVVFNDPVAMPQAGLFAHVRLDPEWSVRVLAAYAVVPRIHADVESRVDDKWEWRHTIELRPSVGYALDPAVEARLFATLRYTAVEYAGVRIGRDSRTGEIIYDERYPEWLTHWWFGGGTEWLFRPESSRRLELGVALGFGARTAPEPSPSSGVERELIVHAAGSVGWLF